jgi:hypothetical protein
MMFCPTRPLNGTQINAAFQDFVCRIFIAGGVSLSDKTCHKDRDVVIASWTAFRAYAKLVGHGFSRDKMLIHKRFANLKVCPTLRITGFGAASTESAEKKYRKCLDLVSSCLRGSFF